MKICFGIGLLVVFLNVFDLCIADIPNVYGNATSLFSGIIAMIIGLFGLLTR